MKKILLTGILLLVVLLTVGCVTAVPGEDPLNSENESDTISSETEMDPVSDETDEGYKETDDESMDTTEETVPVPENMNYFDNFPLTPISDKGIAPTDVERKKAMDEINAILNDLSLLPVSFQYGKKQFQGIGEDFTEVDRQVEITEDAVAVTVTTDYDSTLQVKVLITAYPDYCAYEWTVWFSNIGDERSEVLSAVNAADLSFGGSEPIIRGISGDGGVGEGPYSAYSIALVNTKSAQFQNDTGRPNEGQNTYYNLEYGAGGAMISIGWPGCWMASFTYDETAEMTHLTAGQRYLNTYLEPGETIRTPMMSFLFYEGRDENRATNLWRHWFIDCNIREIEGNTFEPALMSSASWKYSCMENATDTNQCQWIRDYKNGGVILDYFWMDAGWYYKTGTTSLTSWLESGNWNVDKSRFPSGMADISGYADSIGCRTILWFEPEVVRLQNRELDADGIRPEWILGSDDGNWRLANYGDPDFIKWLTDRVISILDEGDISLYRQDFGFVSPVNVWLNTDKKQNRTNRVGITENLYVQGYLQFWDNLIAWNPDLMIDTCASGGNRIDLETLRRSVPLHKTDYNYSDQNQKQAMSQALFAWIPYFGAVTTGPDATAYTVSDYDLYSSFCPAIVLDYVPNSKMNWDTMKKLCDQWETIKHLFYKDYYPLTEWSNSASEWRGWEFFDPETDTGFVQMFRPENASEGFYTVKLLGLDSDTVYMVTNTEGRTVATGSGNELMSNGFDVHIASREAILLFIETHS